MKMGKSLMISLGQIIIFMFASIILLGWGGLFLLIEGALNLKDVLSGHEKEFEWN